ncbi:MAG: hypothetical protein ABI401_13260 [Candidatus Dormibacter sp.]
MTNMIDRIPTVTIQRVTAALVILIVGFWLLSGLFLFAFTTLYLVFIVVTILVVRSVPVQPGQWLARRAVRRGLVSAIALGSILLALSHAGPNDAGGEPFILMALALGFVFLGRATQRIASAPDRQVDERQEALRNRAHRLAYGIFAPLAAGIVLVTYVAGAASRAWLASAFQGSGTLLTFFLLLVFLPAMVLAWLEPDRLVGTDSPQLAASRRASLAITMVALALVTPIALSVALVLVPIRTTSFFRPEQGQTGAKCTYFDARAQVGLGFGAVVPLSAVACSDGRTASEDWGLNNSDCHPNRTEMTTVDTVECTRTTDASGTLHFTYRARVRSAVLPFLARDVVMTLVMAGDGHVVRFP